MPNGQTRILLIYNPHGVVDRDICMASRNSGIEVKTFAIEVSKSPEGHTLERIDLLEIAQAILSFNPDFVLTVNGSGLDNKGFFAYFCAFLKLPLVLWYVDEPFVIPEWGLKFIPQTAVGFTFDRYYERRLRDWGIQWVHPLPLGANEERLLGYSPSVPNKHPYAHRVSFVGALEFPKIQYLLRNISTLWSTMPPGMPDVLDKALGRYITDFKRDTGQILRECARSLGISFEFPNGIVKQMVLSFIDREASFRLRHEAAASLKPFGISIYGEPFWEKIVGKESYKGPIDYYSSAIATLYRTSRINLNISKYQLKTTVNQRVFDCPLCNGFLLTDFREDIEDYFDIDRDVAVFHDLADLKKKVAFYLDHEEKAKAIAERGKETILEKHTYKHRLEEMASRVRAAKNSAAFEQSCEAVMQKSAPARFQTFLERLRQDTPRDIKSMPEVPIDRAFEGNSIPGFEALRNTLDE